MATISMCNFISKRIITLNRSIYSFSSLKRSGVRALCTNVSTSNNKEVPDGTAPMASTPNPDQMPPEGPTVEDVQKMFSEEKEALTKQIDEIQDKYKRALAETENVRQRMQKQIDDVKLFGIQAFCKDLLDVVDVLGRATESIPPAEISDRNPHLKNLFQGLKMTETNMLKVFNSNGLFQINPNTGDKFDPNLHEAMFEQVVEGVDPGNVAVVTKIGHRLHQRTIRPAQVGVSKSD